MKVSKILGDILSIVFIACFMSALLTGFAWGMFHIYNYLFNDVKTSFSFATALKIFAAIAVTISCFYSDKDFRETRKFTLPFFLVVAVFVVGWEIAPSVLSANHKRELIKQCDRKFREIALYYDERHEIEGKIYSSLSIMSQELPASANKLIAWDLDKNKFTAEFIPDTLLAENAENVAAIILYHKEKRETGQKYSNGAKAYRWVYEFYYVSLSEGKVLMDFAFLGGTPPGVTKAWYTGAKPNKEVIESAVASWHENFAKRLDRNN